MGCDELWDGRRCKTVEGRIIVVDEVTKELRYLAWRDRLIQDEESWKPRGHFDENEKAIN